MDADENCILYAFGSADGVGAGYTVFEGDVIVFGYQQFCIVAFVFKVGDYSPCNVSCVGGFDESAVRRAFAGSVDAMAGVDENFHVVEERQHCDSFAKVGNFQRFFVDLHIG